MAKIDWKQFTACECKNVESEREREKTTKRTQLTRSIGIEITAYLANTPSSEGFSGLQSLQNLVALESIASKQTSRMQPTVPQSAGAADMDLPAVQSMDWLFKKERIYLLAQFWQQVNSFNQPRNQTKTNSIKTMSIVEKRLSSIYRNFNFYEVHVQSSKKDSCPLTKK